LLAKQCIGKGVPIREEFNSSSNNSLLLTKISAVLYLQLDNISKSHGDKHLFDDVSFTLEQGRKMALIAKNGAGKTTLLNIIMGKDIPDSGKIFLRNDIEVTYLSQNPSFPDGLNILDYVLSADNQFNRAIHAYEKAMKAYAHDESPANRLKLEGCSNQMDALNAWEYEKNMKEVLDKFHITDLDQQTSTLSGGQRKRLALAKCLVDKADLLILDEPTNHLDINMIEWLEQYLSRQKISLLLVTHDRYFLDKVCDIIVEIDDYQSFTYQGNYAYYLEKREERIENMKRNIERAKNLYRSELEWMRRMPQARATKAQARIDRFYKIEEKAGKSIREDKTEFSVGAKRMGKKILEINNVSKRFGEKILVKDFSYIFQRGEKIGVVGPNGSGKSSLLNIITGMLPQDEGTIVIGDTVSFGYYRQEGYKETADRRIIDIMKDIAEEVQTGSGSVSVSVFLNHFGFSPKDQYAYFSTLSGGEKRKLYLLMVLMKNPNFIILDEPTNDLDINTLNALESFLHDFPGCLITVSHDRYFMDRLSDHIFVLQEDGSIKDFPGNYSQYLNYRDEQKVAQKPLSENTAEKQAKQQKKASGSNKPSYKYVREYEQLEKDIAGLEEKKEELTKALNAAPTDNVKLMELSRAFQETEKLLEEKTERWMELVDILEN